MNEKTPIANQQLNPLLLIVCGLASLTFARANGSELFVSPDGNDLNPGSVQQPLATLEAARDKVRKLKAEGWPSSGITIFLRAGNYPISQTVEFIDSDSGTEDSPIVYSAYKRESVHLIGGKEIPPELFSPVTDTDVVQRLSKNARDSVLQAPLQKLGLSGFERIGELGDNSEQNPPPELWDLYFNSEPMTLARWPNEGFARFEVVEQGSRPRHFLTDLLPENRDTGPRDVPGVFKYDGERPVRWKHAKNYWLHGYFYFDWFDEHIAVKQIDTEKQQITLAKPAFYGIGGEEGVTGHKYYAVNLLEEIDEPGEYYINGQTGVLYFWPPQAIDKGVPTLAILDGPILSCKNASHMIFRGLTVEVSRGGGMRINDGTEVVVTGCTFRNLGSTAIIVRGGSNHGIVSCDLYNLNQDGIALVGGDQRTLTPAGHYAINNNCHDYARVIRSNAPAIGLGGVGQRVANNYIHDAPHWGLSYAGNNHVIELNEFCRLCEDTDDGGGIYAGRDLSTRGNVIRHNLFHHITGRPGKHVHGVPMVYLDFFIAGDTITGNVFYYGGWRSAIAQGGTLDGTITNNIFVDVGAPVEYSSAGLTWCREVVFDMLSHFETSGIDPRSPPWSTRFPEMTRYEFTYDWLAMPKGNVFVNNILYKTKKMEVTRTYDPQVPESAIEERDNLKLDKDPFVDVENLDFRFRNKEVIKVLLPGFEPIPLEKFGLYTDEYRTEVPPRQ